MFIKLKNLNNRFEDNIEKKGKLSKLINSVTRNIYENQPAGLLHAQILSKIVKRSIRIWYNGQAVYVYGKSNGKPVLEAEYNRENRNATIGHWSMRGGKDGATSTIENGCLYEVIASQTGLRSTELKRKTTIAVRRHCRFVLNALLDADEPLLGGARYTGRGPPDAQRVLDASQNGQCHPEGRPGHPRGHSSHPPTGRSDDTVETYSYSSSKSGFLSRSDQDLVGHYTLITDSARDLMERLNQDQFKVAKHISRAELDYDPLPQAQEWSAGNKEGSPDNFRTVCLVGKHFLNQHNNAYADIFVLTFYPVL